MFENYPKKRIELPDEYKKIYKSRYLENRKGKTFFSHLTKIVEMWLHKQIARDVKEKHNLETLEVGAGTLNQLDFEKTKPYDVIEPLEFAYKESANFNKVRNIYNDISEVDLSKRYDRITTIGCFEHIANLPEVVAKCTLLLKNDGCIRVGIPSEGAFLWDISWRLTTGREFEKQYGLSHKVVREYEHISTAKEIEEVLFYFFDCTQYKVLGFSRSLSLHRFYELKNPKKKLAEKYLLNLKNEK